MEKSDPDTGNGEGKAPRGQQTMLRGIRTSLGTHLCLHLGDLGSGTVMALRAMFTHDNPEFHKKQSMGYWIGDTPAKIKSWRIEDGAWTQCGTGRWSMRRYTWS